MRTLIIDNYDSFTFNLYQYIAEVNQEPPIVVKNDELTEAELADLDYDNLLISPGPGRPDIASDFGLCAHLIRAHKTPILGVCLGHQGIAHVFGGRVLQAPQVMHGRASHIHHQGQGVFQGLPTPFKAIRYHSLIAESAAAPDLQATAHTDDGVLMGLQHRRLPIWGVQFHPESICTEHGMALLKNFRDLSMPFRRGRAPRVVHATPLPPERQKMRVRCRRLDRLFDAEAAFKALYAHSSTAFWLDSSLMNTGMSRFSYMGDASGPLADTLTYDSGTKTLRRRRHGRETVQRESIFDYLDRTTQADLLFDQAVPFDFHGGWVGYFGYELKQECGSEAPFPSPHADAIWVFADRFLVFDHQARETWLVVVGDDDDEAWFAATQARLDSTHVLQSLPTTPSGRPASWQLRQHKAAYVEAIRTALDEIEAGESYEICLTNMISCPVRGDGFSLYRVLRAINPAPFAAYLRFGGLEVLSASPERFLHVDGQGNVAARPIKGTAPRGATPAQDKVNALKLQTDEKSRAENLMIVDLLRNDLGAVCEIGSVTVPELMAIETYATLHQMVSTVSGRLKSDCSAVKCAQRAFPGGSMTGAPKLRTMQILDRLEQAARGIYSGALGYFGLNGTADLSIVIRTIVLENGHASIGVGGAILALSDPEAEFDEILLKAQAQLSAIQIANRLEAPADIERVSEDTSP